MMKRLVIVMVTVFFTVFLLTGCNLLSKATLIAEGDSMSPTINDQDRFLVDKSYYSKNKVNRGDIILYTRKDKRIVKRVFGLPGELIQFKNGQGLVDGKPIYEEFVFDNGFGSDILEKGITLGEDEYFILGDFPQHSADSRYIGPIKKNNIIGKVIEIKSK